MHDTEYFQHDIYSNSFLTILKEKVKNKNRQRKLPKNPHFYRDGNEFENALLYNQPTNNKIIKKMVEKVRGDSFYQSIISHPQVKIQHEFYGRFYGLRFKCKTDLVIKGVLVPDIKSTGAKSCNGFIKSINRFDYDRQIYIYMTMAKVDNGVFIACSKEKNPKLFIVSVKKGDYIYNSGKRKTEELISILKSLL